MWATQLQVPVSNSQGVPATVTAHSHETWQGLNIAGSLGWAGGGGGLTLPVSSSGFQAVLQEGTPGPHTYLGFLVGLISDNVRIMEKIPLF